MTDKGPHSVKCATADGADCHCDCHGTKHGIAHLPSPGGTHGPHVQITPVKGTSGKTTHYVVINRRTGLPPGGGTPEERHAHHIKSVKVTATSTRTKTLPPETAAAAEKLRAALPKDAAGWDGLKTRMQSSRGYNLERAADADKRADSVRARRQSVVDSISEHMRAEGMTAAEIRKATTPEALRKRGYVDIKNADDSIAHFEAEAQQYRDRASTASDQGTIIYKLDRRTGRKMPSDALNAHLDNVIEVGHQALAAISEHFDKDDKIAEIRARIETLKFALHKREATVEIRRREAEIIREVLASARSFGGAHHRDLSPEPSPQQLGRTPPPADWRDRITKAEAVFPDEWVHASAALPLNVASRDRAHYSHSTNTLAVPDRLRAYDGAFADSSDEVAAHEMGHRMERMVPGLTDLEFAFVRRRSTAADGTLEDTRKLSDITGHSGYDAHEVAFEDKWKQPYAGKTYEGSDPATSPWEVFQVGLQDLYGRSSDKFGDDELQAFMLGALLTLG